MEDFDGNWAVLNVHKKEYVVLCDSYNGFVSLRVDDYNICIELLMRLLQSNWRKADFVITVPASICRQSPMLSDITKKIVSSCLFPEGPGIPDQDGKGAIRAQEEYRSPYTFVARELKESSSDEESSQENSGS